MKKLILALWVTFGLAFQSYAELKEYELNITLNEKTNQILINNTSPAPTLYANKGDTLRIVVNNKMSVESSIHWHGVLLPNNQDGVPNITTAPIEAGGQLIYEYAVEQTGTYWYHSHTGLQEQQGLYGAIVFNDDLQKKYNYQKDSVIMLSDSSSSSLEEITNNLEKAGMHNNQKSEQSHASHHAASMPESSSSHGDSNHASDIIYDNILINGQKDTYNISSENAGEWLRLRIINAGASSYFKLSSSDNPIYIIAADGKPIEPTSVQSFNIVNGETYDILVQSQNQEKQIAIEAIGQNLESQLVISATNTSESQLPQADFEKQALTIKHLDNAYELKSLDKADQKTAPSEDYKEIDFNLTGSMMPYRWSINDKIFGEADHIIAKQNQILRINFINKTDMPHPMHLHGYYFNIVKQDGTLSIPKHTVNVAPDETVTIEFDTSTLLGKWMIHCHNLYHMKYGMMQMIEVQ